MPGTASANYGLLMRASRETRVHREPAPDGQWGSIERIAADAPLAAAAHPHITVRMADLD